jgi:hypothetical protein
MTPEFRSAATSAKRAIDMLRHQLAQLVLVIEAAERGAATKTDLEIALKVNALYPGNIRDHQASLDKLLAACPEDPMFAAFRPGATVVCRDARNGASFLKAGETYTIESAMVDTIGGLRLNLVGMARAWEVERFDPPVPSKPTLASVAKRRTEERFDANGNPLSFGRCDDCGQPDGPDHSEDLRFAAQAAAVTQEDQFDLGPRMSVRCAWCGRDMGEKDGPAGMVGHGICHGCAMDQANR